MENTSLLKVCSESLLWPSPRASSESAWHGHVSFMHWLASVCSPRIFVELGTHNGVSFAAACNASKKRGLATKLFAIDTWQGDEHAGSYPDAVYEDVKNYCRRNFSDDVTLMRMLFQQALPNFRNDEIDILHIDGLHTYEAVREDFESWLPKMSSKGVILFHDIAVLDSGFGVWKLWEEISSRYPAFSFSHCHGLGVLLVGRDVPESVADLAGTNFAEADRLRDLFARASDVAQMLGLQDEVRRNCAPPVSDAPNIALDKEYRVSSSMDGCEPHHKLLGSIKNGTYSFHTKLEHMPWINIDLGAIYKIEEIKIFNRLDMACHDRIATMKVSISENDYDWKLVHDCGGQIFGGIYGIPLKIQLNGRLCRFVRLWLTDTNYFHLDQVEVFGWRDI